MTLKYVANGQGVDFIVIDTPPHSATDAAEAARRADVVLTPVEPHLFALETVSKLAELLKVAGNPPAFFVINKAPTQGSEGANAAEFIEKQGFTVSPVIIHLRAAHRHASNVGKVAVEYGVPSEKGKNRTLGCREWPERSVFSGRYAGVAAPEVIAGQVDVFPAQRR